MSFHPSKVLPWIQAELDAAPSFLAKFGEMVPVLEDPVLQPTWKKIGEAEMTPETFLLTGRVGQERKCRLYPIARAIRQGLRPMSDWDRMTGTERRDKAKRIGKLVSDLAHELKMLEEDREDDRGIYPNLPSEVHMLLSVVPLELATSVDAEARTGRTSIARLSDVDGVSRDALIDALQETFWYAIKRLPTTLGAVAHGFDLWGDTSPPLYRPAAETAQRQVFMQALTHTFVELFGRPMREETLAITGHFFDVSTLSTADLSRLAPVPNARSE